MISSSPRFTTLVAGAVALVLSGCAGPIDLSDAERVDGAPTTINAAELAVVAEGIVLEQGFSVDIDCGTDDVPFVVGTSLECDAFDEVSEASGAYTLTISSIEGTDYVLDVVGSERTPTAAPEPAPALESAEAFAGLTADAIAGSLGETPVVDCGSEDIEIFTGQEVRCSYTTASATGFVISTVTSFDGSFYEISVVEE
jgi:hypothetical protein